MSSLFCGCCIRLFRRSDARSPNLLTVEPIGVPSDTSLGDNDHGTTNSVPDSPTSDSAHLVLNDSVPPVNFENMDQEVHSVVTTAIRLQDDRAEVDSTSTTPSRSGSLPTDVQPSDSGPISSSFISPHPAQEVRVAAETVSASDEPHVPSAVDELTELREKCRHFRVLVLGRANAGKTTLLKAVCGAAGDPKVVKEDRWGNLVLNDEGPQEGNEDDNIAASYPQSLLSPTAGRGEHNIETQLVFPSNPGFIFHDSRGFEAGSDEELKSVTEFIRSKGNSRELSKQLHVIWYCIPTDNEARLLSRPEQELLRECSAGPVIFTKFDSLEARVFHELKGTGLTRQQAQQSAPQHAIAEFQRNHLSRLLGEKPPKYICLKKMHKEQNNTEIQEKMAELIQHTVDAMGVDALKLLLVSVQRNNLQLTIEYAVKQYVGSLDCIKFT
ncbi:hypothetical protein BOTBODRAFT_178675 [Botryobasidium botryosum FD-172 SS1]|uniref:G domain-containing protein n=1 Tax=Botryobasidium botryosum (strain FD-172 SS1) TaxID=930990 RepID=A0A067MEE5_BOTB1|nr:hypothetical protein BOTBODRAFT_178675 [Botryobasidium botryosum FD-172 SS1]